jgi:hypothetical protein
VELAFFGVHVEVVMPESLQDLSYVATVVFHHLGVDEDVIGVDHHEDIGHVVEDIIHEILEGVGHSEWHYQVFE